MAAGTDSDASFGDNLVDWSAMEVLWTHTKYDARVAQAAGTSAVLGRCYVVIVGTDLLRFLSVSLWSCYVATCWVDVLCLPFRPIPTSALSTHLASETRLVGSCMSRVSFCFIFFPRHGLPSMPRHISPSNTKS